MEKTERRKKKSPWGIVAGGSAIVVFYATVAIIVLFLVAKGVKGQTNEKATLFDEWYQTVLFVADIIAFLVMTASAALAVYTKKKIARGSSESAESAPAEKEISQ